MHFAGRMTRSPSLNLWLFVLALATLSVLYLLQTATPLRLDNDSADYLRMAAAIADGRSLRAVSLPLGYPVFLALLDRAGLGSSFGFVLANCFFLGIAVWALWTIYDDCPVQLRRVIVLLTLLVTPVVRSVAAPLPEAAFLATSLLALLAMKIGVSAEGWSRLRWLATALVLVGVAMTLRLVAVALVPALLWSSLATLHHPRAEPRPSRRLAAATIVIVLLLAASVVALSRTAIFETYVSQPRYWYAYGQLASPVLRRITGTLGSLGELVLNLPLSRFHNLKPIFVAAGVIAGPGLLFALRRSVHWTPVRVYLLSYVTILVFWPYDSPRLWMPITPLLVALLVTIVARYLWTPPIRPFIVAYAAWFALAGLIAIAYTTRISLSGEEFARLYGRNGGMASGNQEGPATGQTMSPYNALADSILRRYGGTRR